MEYIPLDVTVISGDALKNVNLISTMSVYVVVSISGTKRKTSVDRDGGTSPMWNYRLKFSIEEPAIATQNLQFLIRSERAFGDRDIGQVTVPVRELLNCNSGSGTGERVVEYQVRTTSGKPKGSLKFSYKFGDKITIPTSSSSSSAHPPNKAKTSDEPVMAYPPPAGVGAGAAYSSHHPPGVGYAMQAPYPPQAGYGYPPQAAGGYGYPPPAQPGYGYPPQAQAGYGYPPAGYGYPPQPQMGYGYPPQVVQPQQPKKKKGSRMGLGLGAGLLGGLLVGDMISDVGEMAAYDAGYDAGFGDGDFDF